MGSKKEPVTQAVPSLRAVRVDCEASITELPQIYINGGKRGYIISIRTSDALDLLKPRLVHAAR